MVGKNNKRVFITLSDEELELLEKLISLTGATKSKIIGNAIRNYVPGQIGIHERYFRQFGLNAYTKEPLTAEEMMHYGLHKYDYPLTPEANEILKKALEEKQVNNNNEE